MSDSTQNRAREARRQQGHAGMMLGSDKATNFRGTIKRLLQYGAKYKAAVVMVFILAIGSTVFTIAGPRILGTATTELFEGTMARIAGTGGIDLSAIGRILVTVLGIYLASAAFSAVMGWTMAGVATDLSYRLRQDIISKIDRIPLKYFDSTPQGDVLSRITNDIDTVNQSLSQSLTQIITSIVTVVGVLGMMFSINWIMTLAALIMLPVSGVIVGGVMGRSRKHFRAQQEYLGKVNGHVEEMFGGHLVVKAFNAEERSVAVFDEQNGTLYTSAWKAQFLTGLLRPMMGFVSNLGYVVVAVIGATLAARGALTVGNIQAFIQYVAYFTQPVTQLASMANVLQMTAAAAERVFTFLDEDQEIPETEAPVSLERVDGHVEFRDVHFAYDPEVPVIKGFSAAADPGTKIAIVGPTGAGKTTMVKLLMRFYDVAEGAIFVDGHDLRDYRRRDLRDNFAMVLQDTWLYNGTIRENIRYGRPDATDEEVVAAAEAAHADHFIRTQPEGYDLVLNEETSNLSQGQKQLLTIARAILADPRILILDEATSSVDTRTEELIQKAMDGLMAGRTTFVIAHRLSTIRNADLILVMDEGDIVEQGTHNELLERGGFYAELYESQFEPEAVAG
jgi:ATP-binding cassette subfamily B multidrug efflux pump